MFLIKWTELVANWIGNKWIISYRTDTTGFNIYDGRNKFAYLKGLAPISNNDELAIELMDNK